MSGRIDGRVALITGASRGIGRATALLFAAEGASVIVNYASRADMATEVIETICDAGGQAIAVRANVADRSDVENMVLEATERFGTIDILVNNAGLVITASTLTMELDDLDAMRAVNVDGIIHCAQLVVPKMIEREYGKIINISSIAGLDTSVPGTTPYALTKAAVISLTKRMAFEFGPSNINVNAICPGGVKTDMLKALAGSDEKLQEILAASASNAVLGRVGEPENIAAAILFLASDDSSYITGQVLTVDGGRKDFFTHSA